jgi:D-sedoheptulose 7-phosphate isomerase
MEMDAYLEREFAGHRAAFEATDSALRGELARLIEVCAEAITASGKLMFFGNGGSAADAQHLATELTVRFAETRPPIAALALTTDSSTLTAIGNDLDFDEIFARQIAALGRPGDLALAISTSGKSRNVVRGLAAARDLGLVTAALTGRGGGDLVALADPLLAVPSESTARIQEMHIALGQLFCGALERRLGLV